MILVLCGAVVMCVSKAPAPSPGEGSAGEASISKEGQSSDEECLASGFNRTVLRCNACDAIAKILENNKDAEKECRKCCAAPLSRPRESFELLVLEVDQRFLPMYPEISRAVEKHKKSGSAPPYSALTVRFSFGARPTLHLYKERSDELPAESVFVGSWNLDVLEDFVLESTPEA